MIDTVLFDLDGTLLPLDQDVFMKYYFGGLAKKVAPLGYDPKALVKGIWTATGSMVKNDGSCTNEQAFWKRFAELFGERVYADEKEFDSYYKNEFDLVINACNPTDRSAKVVKKLKDKGITVALATNPLFPSIATYKRAKWAGLDPNDFALITTYENSVYCKPNPKYYEMILEKLEKKPENCLMVGNDVKEDAEAARKAGLEVFLLTDCLINKDESDLSAYNKGGFDELDRYIDTL